MKEMGKSPKEMGSKSENHTRKPGSHGIVKVTNQIPKGPKPPQIRYVGDMKTL